MEDRIRDGLKRFQTEIFPQRRRQFEQLAASQSPRALFLTCGDYASIQGCSPGASQEKSSWSATRAIWFQSMTTAPASEFPRALSTRWSSSRSHGLSSAATRIAARSMRSCIPKSSAGFLRLAAGFLSGKMRLHFSTTGLRLHVAVVAGSVWLRVVNVMSTLFQSVVIFTSVVLSVTFHRETSD